jgi:hypothetical protein
MKKRYIRRADGSLHALADDDDRVAKDGEVVSVGMLFMDASGTLRQVTDDETRSTTMDAKYWQDRQAYMERYPAFMHDADGNEVMPWRDYLGSDQHRRDLQRCHAEVTAAEVVADEERRRPEQPKPTSSSGSMPIANPTAADLEAGRQRVEAAYAEYNDRLTNAWKGGEHAAKF